MKHAELKIPSWFIRKEMNSLQDRIVGAIDEGMSNDYLSAITHKYFALNDLIEKWANHIMNEGEGNEQSGN